MKLNWVDLGAYAAFLAFLGLAIVTGPRGTLAYVALGLSLVCAILWFIARLQLGDAFTVTAQARHLVTSGLYAKLRHPIYVFGTFAFLFVVLALIGWAALVVWAVVLLIQVGRLRQEEKVLAETFGEEYAAYRRRTWF